MIYGINFNGKHIPPQLKKRFASYKKVDGLNLERGVYARLVGVCESTEEKDMMLSQADNGHRRLHVEVRNVVGGMVYGIYVY